MDELRLEHSVNQFTEPLRWRRKVPRSRPTAAASVCGRPPDSVRPEASPRVRHTRTVRRSAMNAADQLMSEPLALTESSGSEPTELRAGTFTGLPSPIVSIVWTALARRQIDPATAIREIEAGFAEDPAALVPFTRHPLPAVRLAATRALH